LGRRILVVDDDGLVLRSVAKVLSRAGYDVLTAVDVDSALRHAEAGPIDAALVDYTLSYETGLTVLSHLREVQPRCVRTLLTGRSDPAVIVEAINRGEVARVIKKPFDPNHLLQELDDAFESAERMRRVQLEQSAAEDEAEGQALDQVLRSSLSLALQPIFDFSEGTPRPFAYEALLRPKHDRLGTPADLLSATERHDRIHELGSSVFSLAARVLKRIPPNLRLFVNLHPAQLGEPEHLESDLRRFAGHTPRVTLEITEHSPLNKLARWEESIHLITASGCTIAVDDLGAGYSSLSILADLQPAYIKLDMSLVRNIHLEPRKQRLVSLLRAFGDATEARLIAEGVESEDETRALLDCGIGLLQGFHLGRPSERYVDPQVSAA
jgi:EAL domain-containing protein (putative c-di-GMP-specific phosphodiesterase class I)